MLPNYPPKPIYLDYHSTTPVDPRVAELMVYCLITAFGNASSIDHSYGDEAEKGALVISKGHHLEPISFGGRHQKGLRSGTLNVPGIVGLGEACRLRQLEMEQDEQQISRQRERLQTLLQAQIPNLRVNGDLTARLGGNLHISLPGISNSAIIARIRHQLAISTGAACSSGVATPSHVLRALKLSDEMSEGALRIGVGKFTTDKEIEQAADILSTAVNQVRQVGSSVKINS